MPEATINGVQLHYDVWSPDAAASPGATPLVIARGLAASAAEWAGFLEPARSHGPVLTFDPRGSGGSTAVLVPERTTIADLTADLLALLDTLGWERVHLLGHSLGGIVAIDFVLRHPSRIAALILESATPEAAPPERRARALALLSRGAPTALLQERAMSGREPAGIEVFPGPQSHAPAAYALINRPDHTPYLEGITAPTLVLVGELETEPLQRGAELLHGWIPTSRLVRIAGAGHHAHIEQPEEFAKLALSFIDEVNSGAGG